MTLTLAVYVEEYSNRPRRSAQRPPLYFMTRAWMMNERGWRVFTLDPETYSFGHYGDSN